MKYLNKIFLLIFGFCTLSMGAQLQNVKEFNKILSKYDVIDYIQELPNGNPKDFWVCVQNNNASFQEAKSAAVNGRAKEAQRVIGEAVFQMKQYNQIVPLIESADSLTSLLKQASGIEDMYREAKLFITCEYDENAYTYPGGDIYLTGGIVLRLNADPMMLLGVYSHELSHFVLQHSFSNIYFSNKRLKKNKAVSNIVTALAVGAGAYADAKFASDGVRSNVTGAAIDFSLAMDNAIKNDYVKYIFKYSKEQEYEADIIAYRFLEWLGIGGDKYIEALRYLQSDLEIFQNDESEHPSTANRIALLQYMSSPQYADFRVEYRHKKEKEKKYKSVNDDVYF